MSDLPPAANQASDTTAVVDKLTCKTCNRTLATISAEGNLVAHGELDEGCALCKDMVMHYNEYEEVKVYFKELEHRRDNYRPRQLALEVVHEAQMNLGNFIQSVAAWKNPDGEEIPEKQSYEQLEGQAKEQTDPPHARDADAQPHCKRSLSPQSSPGPRKRAKRPRLAGREHRVSFDPSVVFRDAEAGEKRADAEFSRNSEGYSPGRYAAPEGKEWLDTSGNSMKETRFFGVHKKGKQWLPTKEGLEMDEEWEQAGIDEDTRIDEDSGNGTKIEADEVDEDYRSQVERQGPQVQGGVPKTEAEISSNIAIPTPTSPAEPDTSNQESAPDQRSSVGIARPNVKIDEHSCSDDEAAPDEDILGVGMA